MCGYSTYSGPKTPIATRDSGGGRFIYFAQWGWPHSLVFNAESQSTLSLAERRFLLSEFITWPKLPVYIMETPKPSFRLYRHSATVDKSREGLAIGGIGRDGIRAKRGARPARRWLTNSHNGPTIAALRAVPPTRNTEMGGCISRKRLLCTAQSLSAGQVLPRSLVFNAECADIYSLNRDIVFFR
jgi:hypothetical protein